MADLKAFAEQLVNLTVKEVTRRYKEPLPSQSACISET